MCHFTGNRKCSPVEAVLSDEYLGCFKEELPDADMVHLQRTRIIHASLQLFSYLGTFGSDVCLQFHVPEETPERGKKEGGEKKSFLSHCVFLAGLLLRSSRSLYEHLA